MCNDEMESIRDDDDDDDDDRVVINAPPYTRSSDGRVMW